MTGPRDGIAGHAHRGAAALTSIEKIDVCRGLFAFLVVIAHCLDVTWAIHAEVPGKLSPQTHGLLLYVAAAGIYWVIGFFVISGYCIQLSVERQSAGGSFPLRHYLLARLTRILPLYYAGLVLTVIAETLMAGSRPSTWPHGIDVQTFAAQLLVIQNLSQTFGAFAPSWSITNEMFYYLFYGLIVCLALRRGVRAPRLGLTVCLVLTLVLEAAYFRGWKIAPFRALGLLFGLGIIWFQGAILADSRHRLRGSRRAARIAAGWPAVLALAIALWYSQQVHFQVVVLILGAAFTLMIARFVALDPAVMPPPRNGLAGAVIRSMGLASYPTYLFHGPIVMLAGSSLMRSGLDLDWRLTWVLLSVLGIGTGILLGHLAEKPIMAWRAEYLRHLIQAPARSAVTGTATPQLGIPQ